MSCNYDAQPRSLHEALVAIRESAQGRAEYLREKAERFNQGPEDYKQLMAREKAMIDLAEVVAVAIRRLAANAALSGGERKP